MVMRDYYVRHPDERIVVEQRDGEWYAEVQFVTGLGGDVIPTGNLAFTMPEWGVVLGSGPSPDRVKAMRRLAYLIWDHEHPSG